MCCMADLATMLAHMRAILSRARDRGVCLLYPYSHSSTRSWCGIKSGNSRIAWLITFENDVACYRILCTRSCRFSSPCSVCRYTERAARGPGLGGWGPSAANCSCLSKRFAKLDRRLSTESTFAATTSWMSRSWARLGIERDFTLAIHSLRPLAVFVQGTS